MGVRNLETDHHQSHTSTFHCLFNCFCHPLGKQHHIGQERIIQVEQIIGLLFGHHQGMACTHRADVEKCVKTVILSHPVRGNLTSDNPAENSSHSCSD